METVRYQFDAPLEGAAATLSIAVASTTMGSGRTFGDAVTDAGTPGMLDGDAVVLTATKWNSCAGSNGDSLCVDWVPAQ
jgi:hypothetical protein